jgi:hypothetical protein
VEGQAMPPYEERQRYLLVHHPIWVYIHIMNDTRPKRKSTYNVDPDALIAEALKSQDAFFKACEPKHKGINDPDHIYAIRAKFGKECSGKYITPALGTMLLDLTTHYATRGNWRGYSYIDDFVGSAMVKLTENWWKWNRDKGHPFPYMTQIVYYEFLSCLEKEKKKSSYRDDLIERAGLLPSFSRQLENDVMSKEHWDKIFGEDK